MPQYWSKYLLIKIYLPLWVLIQLHVCNLSHHTHTQTDDESEIGEESEDKWGWSKRTGRGKKHPRSVAPRGWVSKRKKIDRLIKECDALVKATPVS